MLFYRPYFFHLKTRFQKLSDIYTTGEWAVMSLSCCVKRVSKGVFSMSQHECVVKNNGISYTVLAGWDNPLQGFFLVVNRKQEVEDDIPFYSNLDDPALERHMGLPPTFEYFEAKLETLGLNIPKEMLDAIKSKR